MYFLYYKRIKKKYSENNIYLYSLKGIYYSKQNIIKFFFNNENNLLYKIESYDTFINNIISDNHSLIIDELKKQNIDRKEKIYFLNIRQNNNNSKKFIFQIYKRNNKKIYFFLVNTYNQYLAIGKQRNIINLIKKEDRKKYLLINHTKLYTSDIWKEKAKYFCLKYTTEYSNLFQYKEYIYIKNKLEKLFLNFYKNSLIFSKGEIFIIKIKEKIYVIWKINNFWAIFKYLYIFILNIRINTKLQKITNTDQVWKINAHSYYKINILSFFKNELINVGNTKYKLGAKSNNKSNIISNKYIALPGSNKFYFQKILYLKDTKVFFYLIMLCEDISKNNKFFDLLLEKNIRLKAILTKYNIFLFWKYKISIFIPLFFIKKRFKEVRNLLDEFKNIEITIYDFQNYDEQILYSILNKLYIFKKKISLYKYEYENLKDNNQYIKKTNLFANLIVESEILDLIKKNNLVGNHFLWLNDYLHSKSVNFIIYEIRNLEILPFLRQNNLYYFSSKLFNTLSNKELNNIK